MSPDRAECPVLTCTRDMPIGQVMCAHCWSKVPNDFRRSINAAVPGTSRYKALVGQAVQAAQ